MKNPAGNETKLKKWCLQHVGQSGGKWFVTAVRSHRQESEVADMTGEYQHSIDTKGRLFIPAALREELGDTIYVTISIERALAVYSEDAWREKEEKFNALPSAQARRIRPLFVNAAKCTLDAQGRILVPQKLRAFANL